MTPNDVGWPHLDALAGLAPLTPDDASARRVRARCLAALDSQTRRRAAALPRLVDVAGLAAAGVYLAAIVAAALRVLAAG
jgi:hypothetical protein